MIAYLGCEEVTGGGCNRRSKCGGHCTVFDERESRTLPHDDFPRSGFRIELDVHVVALVDYIEAHAAGVESDAL